MIYWWILDYLFFEIMNDSEILCSIFIFIYMCKLVFLFSRFLDESIISGPRINTLEILLNVIKLPSKSLPVNPLLHRVRRLSLSLCPNQCCILTIFLIFTKLQFINKFEILYYLPFLSYKYLIFKILYNLPFLSVCHICFLSWHFEE